MIKFCEYCFNHPKSKEVYDNGYIPYLYDTDYKCPECGNKLKDTNVPDLEYLEIASFSKDINFIHAMMQLHEKDPIEYQLKMATIRNQVQQQKQIKSQEKARNTLKCPRCGSTAITTGARGANHFWGLIGASKTVNRCGSCGYTWEPKR